jgi:tungstate transport system substrate-binding protein
LTGATGLIEALATDYLSTLPEQKAIAWICNHSLNSQVALYRDYVDLALTYERDREELAISEGWSLSAGCIFHDHFCLAGPKNDPANIKGAKSVTEAFRRLATRRVLFHSRADGSATMEKERAFWSSCGLDPWADENAAEWYHTSLETPAGALKIADQAGAYLLTDRSTVLRQTCLGTISNTTAFLEPTSSDDILMNSGYALYSPFTEGETKKAVAHFIEYLLSDRGQDVIGSFGAETCGLPLFASVAEGFARTKLVGGYPRGSKWIYKVSL